MSLGGPDIDSSLYSILLYGVGRPRTSCCYLPFRLKLVSSLFSLSRSEVVGTPDDLLRISMDPMSEVARSSFFLERFIQRF